MPKHRVDSTVEDRAKIFFSSHRDRCDELVVLINCAASEVDAEHAFIALGTSKLTIISGGMYRETEHGTFASLMELAAFHLYPHFGKCQDRDQAKINVLLKALEELNSIRGFEAVTSIDVSDLDLARIQMQAKIYSEGVRGSSYPRQIRLRIEKIQGLHESWFSAQTGIGPMRVLAILDASEKVLKSNGETKRRRFDSFKKQLLQEIEAKAEGKDESNLEPEQWTAEKLNDSLRQLMEESSEMGAISFDKLVMEIPDLRFEEWTSLKTLVGFSSERRKTLDRPSHLRATPIYFLSGNRFMILELSSVYDAIFEAFDAATRNQSFRDRTYIKKLASWMESRAHDCLLRVFPSTSVFLQLTYPDPDNPGGETELDGAVLWGPFLILVEVKGKQFRSQSRSGDPHKLRDDIKASIEDSFTQASRAQRYIASEPSAVFTEKGSTRKLTVSHQSVRRVFPISVTLHHFGGLATQLATLRRLDLFKTDSYPWSLSLDDLDIITRFSGSPDIFLHYAQRRLELQASHEHIMAMELDLFGFYLETRLDPKHLWDKEPEAEGKGRSFAFLGGAEKFDNWYQSQLGLAKDPCEITLELPPQIYRLITGLRLQDDDAARWIAFSLLNLSDEALFRIEDAVTHLHLHPAPSGRVMRATFKDGPLVISIVAGGRNLSNNDFREQVAHRCCIEKYRLHANASLAIGIWAGEPTQPYECACWSEGPWEKNPDFDARIEAENPLVPEGQKLPGRNDKCICGTGKKFKKCCLNKYLR